MKPNINNVFVSIIIPTYNRRILLERAVLSVLKQKFQNFEILIIDNFSNDGTKEMIKKLNSPKISFFSISNKGIIAKSRNLGIKKSKGKWIAFLDSDDFWFSNKLSYTLKNLKNCDAVFHDLNDGKIKNKKENLNKKIIVKFDDIYSEKIKLPNSSAVVKKSVLLDVGLLNEKKNLAGAEDHDLWLRLSLKKYRIIKFQKILGNRGYDKNLNFTKTKVSIINNFEIIKIYKKILLLKDKYKLNSFKFYKLGVLLYEKKKLDDSLNFFLKTFFLKKNMLITIKSLFYIILIYFNKIKLI